MSNKLTVTMPLEQYQEYDRIFTHIQNGLPFVVSNDRRYQVHDMKYWILDYMRLYGTDAELMESINKLINESKELHQKDIAKLTRQIQILENQLAAAKEQQPKQNFFWRVIKKVIE